MDLHRLGSTQWMMILWIYLNGLTFQLNLNPPFREGLQSAGCQGRSKTARVPVPVEVGCARCPRREVYASGLHLGPVELPVGAVTVLGVVLGPLGVREPAGS
jgi:hypothetical protein